MFLISIIKINTKEEIGIVPRAVTKVVEQPSQNSFVGVFLTFC